MKKYLVHFYNALVVINAFHLAVLYTLSLFVLIHFE